MGCGCRPTLAFAHKTRDAHIIDTASVCSVGLMSVTFPIVSFFCSGPACRVILFILALNYIALLVAVTFKRGRRLFTHIFLAHALRSARRGRNSLQFVRPYGKPRERQAHSIAFNLKDTSKHLFCAIGVAVGEGQVKVSNPL